MQKLFLLLLANLLITAVTAQPLADTTAFSVQLRTIMNYAANNFKDMPPGYKLQGALDGKVQTDTNGYSFHRSVMAKVTTSSKANKQVLLLWNRIKNAFSNETYSYEEKNGANNILEINFIDTIDDHRQKITLGGKKVKNKITISIDIACITGTTNEKLEIIQKVKKIIIDQLGVAEKEVTDEAALTNDLGADYLDTIELLIALEKAFNISIPDDDMEKIYTVGQMISYIEGRTIKANNNIP